MRGCTLDLPPGHGGIATKLIPQVESQYGTEGLILRITGKKWNFGWRNVKESVLDETAFSQICRKFAE